MHRYTIFCTSEQTKKALELGAPIEEARTLIEAQNRKHLMLPNDRRGFIFPYIPTAEQMIGWLEKQGLCIEPYRTACGYLCTISKVPTGSQIYSQKFEGDDEDSGQFTTRGKAILAAIDVALKYLTENNLIK